MKCRSPYRVFQCSATKIIKPKSPIRIYTDALRTLPRSIRGFVKSRVSGLSPTDVDSDFLYSGRVSLYKSTPPPQHNLRSERLCWRGRHRCSLLAREIPSKLLGLRLTKF